MRFYLTGIDEEKHEICMSAEDKSCTVVIDASGEAWTGKGEDVEVLEVPSGATIYYRDADGNQTYKNYLLGPDGAKQV